MTPFANTTNNNTDAHAIHAPACAYTLGALAEGPPCCAPVPHLSVRQLGVSFHGRPVLDDVSLDIYKGCITALIGPSGCGKTTFLSTLNRLVADQPRAQVRGEVTLDGQSVLAPGVNLLALRRRVGMIFQKPNPFPLSIERNLDLPLREHGVRDRHERRARIQAALTDVGLWDEVADRLGAPAMSLSGGQQQRLCIARALVLQPEVLLMDEPCSALDPMSSRTVEELIARLRGRLTVVIVTHNLAQARRIANYAAFFWMKERMGTLVEFGRCRELFESPQDRLTQAYVSGAAG